MTCEASTVRGEGTELCNETQKGAQFLDVFRSLEVSQRRELFVVGADAAIRDDVSFSAQMIVSSTIFIA